ncbi:ABC transporter substrate-binding protein [Bradyrhizobium sp. Tv2a-2]|uniref:ABC transporter substrate-binding protein n=1 Tax=Bradyrhizobium sp. Tv2a-2 TaxID=113395 RepID=UPI0004678635|nr:ABC transporter substrate-binding protein [Bradyrhizobium sp. Tv2a-2]
MERRAFVLGLSTVVAAWPPRTRAEAAIRTIGLWWSPSQLNDGLFRYKQRLAQLGWSEDRNLRIQVRAWQGDMGTMREQASELLAMHPDVIVASSNPALAILKPLSGGVPVVFVFVADPVGSGFVESLAHPGGNITGFTNFEPAMGGKWLELLREAVPAMKSVLVLMHPETTAHKEFSRSIEAVAGSLQVEIVPAGVHNAVEIERAIADFAANHNGGVIALPHPVTEVHSDLIIQQATSHSLPTIFASATHASAGALITYGIVLAAALLQTTEYVDRILRGTKPADLPVQAPQTFELAVNLKTAKSLGLTIAPTLLARADEVIE